MGGFVIIVGVILMVIIHEGGHFVAARAFNIKATQAFFGFGPTLWSVKRGETEYGVKALPLGGFVKIIGMNPFEEVRPGDQDRAYRVKPFWQKTVVVLAGIASHFVVAFLLFWVVGFVWGTSQLPDPMHSATVSNVGALLPEESTAGPAFTWDFWEGDEVVAIGDVPVSDIVRLDAQSPTEMLLTLQRGGEQVEIRADRFFFGVGDELRAIDGVIPADIALGTVLPNIMELAVFDASRNIDVAVLASSLPLRLALGDQVLAIDNRPVGESAARFVDESGDLAKVTVLRNGEVVDLYTGDSVVPSPAFLAGALEGDRILRVGDDKIASWEDFTTAVRDRPGQPVIVTVEREGKAIALTAVLATRTLVHYGKEREVGFFGVSPSDDVNPFQSLSVAAKNVATGTLLAARGLWDLVSNIDSILAATVSGDNEVLDRTRPISVIGLVQIAGPVERSLTLLGIVNIFVGLLNVVPLYPLDGGHFAVALYEKIRGRPADVRKLLPLAAAVFIFVLGLGILGFYLDWVNPFELPGQ